MRLDQIKALKQPKVWSRPKNSRILLMDGDGACYQAAFSVKTLPTAIKRVQQDVLTKMFMAGGGRARVHLTAKGNRKAERGRVRAAKPYQGSRKGKPKPPLLEPLREALAASGGLPEVSFILQTEVEADDAIIMDSYTFKKNHFFGLGDLTLSVTGRNLLMFYCKAPFDPETTATTSNYYQGIDKFMTPSTRTIGFNIKLKF